MKRSSPVLLVALIALFLPSATPARSAADVPRVDNPAKAPSARTAHLEELWRVGGDTDAEGEIFGVSCQRTPTRPSSTATRLSMRTASSAIDGRLHPTTRVEAGTPAIS